MNPRLKYAITRIVIEITIHALKAGINEAWRFKRYIKTRRYSESLTQRQHPSEYGKRSIRTDPSAFRNQDDL